MKKQKEKVWMVTKKGEKVLKLADKLYPKYIKIVCMDSFFRSFMTKEELKVCEKVCVNVLEAK